MLNYSIANILGDNYKSSEKKSDNSYACRVKLSEQTEEGVTVVKALEVIIDHKPLKADFTALTEAYIADLKKYKIEESAAYAKTPAVKAFMIGNQTSWFDDRQRDSIKSSVEAEKADGRPTTNIFVDDVRYVMSPDDALAMIRAIELYSKDCYTATAIHASNINACTTIEEVEAYDFHDNYPEKCSFDYQPA